MMDFPDVSRARRPGFWTTLALGARMMMRDARAGELRLLVLALVVAVAAVTSVGFLADRVSRALEQWLDAAGGPLGHRYVLEVSSPGIERPVRWHRHWVQFVGREVNVKLAGMGRVRARIVSVPTTETVVLQPQGGSEREYRLADVRDARLALPAADDR